MVAKITFPKRVVAALNYNEKKVQRASAVCIGSSGYLRYGPEMSFHQKLAGLENRNRLNERSTTKTVHLSLNFDPSEKFTDGRLVDIANHYMQRIGFGEQPYLIYRHEDAGHPHLHIVSTTIKGDGSRINTHNIGRNQSEQARKEVEQLYGLKKAQNGPKNAATNLPIMSLEKAVYGRAETKRAITSIVSVVYLNYNYTSLPEFNAALCQFNVLADGGKEGGRIQRTGGLVYRLLNAKGEKVGVPIKASSLAGSPTLKGLAARFAINEPVREKLKGSVKSKLDGCLAHCKTVQQLTEELKKQDVFVLLRRNPEGRLYGITYVDNNSRCVFNGSDLGKGYSAAALQSRLSTSEEHQKNDASPGTSLAANGKRKEQKQEVPIGKKDDLLSILLVGKESSGGTPGGLLKKKRKKKKRKSDF